MAVWLSVPEVPVKAMALLPRVVLAAAVSVTFCAVPGMSDSEAGLAVTPAGSPVMATETLPVKEFRAVASTLTCVPVAPAMRATDVGETLNEKSGAGAQPHTVAQAVQGQHLIGFRQAHFPRQAGIFDRGLRGGARAADMA